MSPLPRGVAVVVVAALLMPGGCRGELDDARLVGTYEFDAAASSLPSLDELVSQLPEAGRDAARRQLAEGGAMAQSFLGSELALRGDHTFALSVRAGFFSPGLVRAGTWALVTADRLALRSAEGEVGRAGGAPEQAQHWDVDGDLLRLELPVGRLTVRLAMRKRRQ